MSTKAKKQIRFLSNRVLTAESRAGALEQASKMLENELVATRAAAVARPASPPAPVAAPPPARTELREYERLSRENYYLAAQYLLNNSGAIIEQKAEERRGGGA